MKKRYILFFLFISCSEDDETTIVKQCKLLRMVSDTPTQIVETTYAYNDKDQIVGQVRTRDGVVDFAYEISYKSDGMVEKVDQGATRNEHSYTVDGKILKQSIIDNSTSEVLETVEYEWSPNSVELTFRRISRTYPYQTTTHEFSDENIIRTVYKSYNDLGDGELTWITEIDYSGFDNHLNQYYVASQNRPGYGIVSKNNYAAEVSTSTSFISGVAQSPTTSTKSYTYEYNKSNATISFITTDETTGVSYPTQVTYEDCPE